MIEGSDNLRQRYETIEQRRQRLLVYVGNGVATLFLIGFGIIAIYSGHQALAVFTLPHCIVTIGNVLLYKFTGSQRLANYGFIYGILALFTYLVATGGVEGTGPLWCYPMIAAAITLQGVRRGILIVAIMFVITLIIFFLPMPWIAAAAYGINFKIRFIASFIALVLFIALHEYARAKNQDELIHVSARLDQLSHTDQLTALPNRRYMITRLEAENSRYVRHLHGYSILYGDIDNFKSINDDYGHRTGDAVLQIIARTIRENVRQYDEVSRWGGEEFLILLPETDQAEAVDIAEKLRAAIAAIAFQHEDALLHLTMSFGAHTVDRHGTIDDFIHCADQKLYLAKNSGKNRIVADMRSDISGV